MYQTLINSEALGKVKFGVCMETLNMWLHFQTDFKESSSISSKFLGLIWQLSSTCSLDTRFMKCEINSWYLRMNENHIITKNLG